MNTKLFLSQLFTLCALFLIQITLCYGSDLDDEQAYGYLKTLELEDLLKVEVTLDEVFDVFDGLIKAKKVSIATGNKQSTARAPAVTTVITAQDIEAMGATDLDEVLETVPGLHVAYFAARYDPIYVIRGIYSDFNPQVLLLINGVPLKNLLTGHRIVVGDGMPINAIERIEIIRGPGSAMYGADAWAGVINIITKKAPQNETGIRLGSFNTKEAWVLQGGHYAGFNETVTVEYRDTDGQKELITADAQTALDKIYDTHASLAPGPVNLSRRMFDVRLDISQGPWQWRTSLRDRSHVGTGAGNSRALDPIGLYAERHFSNDITYQNNHFQDWEITIQLNHVNTGWNVERDIYTYPPDAFGGKYPKGHISRVVEASEQQMGTSLSTVYSGITRHLLRMGLGYSYGKLYGVRAVRNFGIDPDSGLPLSSADEFRLVAPFIKEGVRQNKYLFLQDTWQFSSDWEMTAGLRYDHYSDFGSTVNPRIALVWQTRPNLTTKLLYGRAFRAPAFFELYAINSPVAQGNPDVTPETLESLELALNYRATSNLNLETNLFTYRTDDNIRYVRDQPGTVPIAQNVGQQKGFGLEGELRWKTSVRSSILANYAYVKATDRTTHHDTGNYPRHSAYVRTDWLLIPNWYLDVQANWIADRQRVLGDPRPAIADYTTVDLTLRYKDIREGRANVAFSIRNLFDAEAREPSLGPDSTGMIAIPDDLPLAERSFFVELRYQF